MLSVIVVLFLLLSNINNDIEFKSIIIFIITFIGSYIFLFSLPSFSERGKYLKGEKDIKLFFMQDLTVGGLIFAGLGTLGILGISFASTYISSDLVFNALIGIGGSGLLKLWIFFKTKSIIVVTLMHGAYNSIIFGLRTDFGTQTLGISGISVPEIGINIGAFDRLVSEILNQFFLVALAEEMFIVLVMSFVLIGLKGTFDSSSGYRYVAGGLAVSLWSVYHLINSLT